MSSELERNLNKFINHTLGAAINVGLEKVIQLIENDAKKECPVDDGILRADIKHEIDTSKHEAVVGNTVEYAPYVHEGTGIHAVGGKGRQTPWTYKTADGEFHTTSGQKPNPYLQKAVDKNQGKILTILGRGAATEWKK